MRTEVHGFSNASWETLFGEWSPLSGNERTCRARHLGAVAGQIATSAPSPRVDCHAGVARGLLMQTDDIAQCAQRPEGIVSGLRRGSAPSQ